MDAYERKWSRTRRRGHVPRLAAVTCLAASVAALAMKVIPLG